MDIFTSAAVSKAPAAMQDGYWFTSRLFHIHEGEDELTRPGCFGQQLSEWLTRKLQDRGYHAEPIPEDWGWSVLITEHAFTLFVGCCNANSQEALHALQDEVFDDELAWQCFVVSEPGFLSLQATREAAYEAARQLHDEVGEILRSERQIVLLAEPDGPAIQ